MDPADEPKPKQRKMDKMNEMKTDDFIPEIENVKDLNIGAKRDENREKERNCSSQVDRMKQARKQFDPLPEEWKQKLQHAYDDPNFEIKTPYLTVRNNDLISLLDVVGPNGSETDDVPERLVEAYVRMICDHKNSLSSGPKCAMLSSDLMDLYNPRRKEAPEDIRERIGEELEKQGCKGEDLLKLDYLFIPYHRRGCHWYLLGVAPKQKFFFLIDSVENTSSRDAFPIRDLLGLVLEQLPTIKDENWPLFIRWAASETDDIDCSSNGGRQDDVYNCGMFCITNAMCLAFGYPLRCYRQWDLDEGKRERMATELINGGFGGFEYELFDVPGEWTLEYRHGEEESSDTLYVDAAGVIHKGKDLLGEKGEESITVLERWPAQFDPNDFQHMELLYAVKNPAFDNTSGMAALEEECRTRNIKDWVSWSQGSEELFRKWMENYVAGEQFNGNSFP